MSEEIRYREVRHVSFWLWLILVPVVALFWYGAYSQLILGRTFGAKPASDGALLMLWVIAGVVLPILLGITTYRVQLNERHLSLAFFPFYHQKIPVQDIKSVEMLSVRPFMDYGGWGLKKYGDRTALMVKGRQAVQIRLHNKKLYVITIPTSRRLHDELQALMDGGA